VMVFLVGLGRSVLLGLLLWRHRELLFSWNHGGCQCWGSENRIGSPNTRFLRRCTKARMKERTRNLRKSVLTSKVVNPFTRTLGPPFIGRRRDFYILKLPSDLENIPSVNRYVNVFYIHDLRGSFHTFTSLPLVHTSNPDFLGRRLWLGLPLTSETSFMKIIICQDLRTEIP
jgi:hypothetical protein